MKTICDFCGDEYLLPTNIITLYGVKSRIRKGLSTFCSRACFGLSRRSFKTKTDKIKEKSLYDSKYREINKYIIKDKKHKYFKSAYNPKEAALKRKIRMPKHIEYCRKPEYKAKKHIYDITRQAKKSYGSFYESATLVKEILTNIGGSKQMRLDKAVNNNKTQKRKRNGKDNKS